MKGRFRRKGIMRLLSVLVLSACAAAAFAGCTLTKEDDGRLRDLEFSVAGEGQVPAELAKLIAERQQQPFKLTYTDESHLYIAIGYGVQPTGGYSIRVADLYLTENSIVIDTELMGPEKGENPGSGQSFPYIVIATEYLEEPVVFR